MYNVSIQSVKYVLSRTAHSLITNKKLFEPKDSPNKDLYLVTCTAFNLYNVLFYNGFITDKLNISKVEDTFQLRDVILIPKFLLGSCLDRKALSLCSCLNGFNPFNCNRYHNNLTAVKTYFYVLLRRLYINEFYTFCIQL